jgi:hypothetical protein
MNIYRRCQTLGGGFNRRQAAIDHCLVDAGGSGHLRYGLSLIHQAQGEDDFLWRQLFACGGAPGTSPAMDQHSFEVRYPCEHG